MSWYDDPDIYIIEDKCPTCGGDVSEDYDCPGYRSTWNGNPTIMTCYPSCGNGTVYTCMNNECGWWYCEGWIRSGKDSMGERPWWLDKRREEDELD